MIVYLLRIEGVGSADGQTVYCGPGAAPAYGGDEYISGGLAETPRGASSKWDVLKTSVSSGRFTLILRPFLAGGGGGPVNFQATRARPVTELRAAVDDDPATTTIPVRSTTAASGLAIGDVVYIERESCYVSGVTDGGTPSLTVTRGYAGSTAADHATGADVFTVPPAMTGRKVTVSEVDTLTATSASDESDVLQAYISGEVASGLHWPTFAAVSEFAQGRLNPEPKGAIDTAAVEPARWMGGETGGYLAQIGDYGQAPRFHADGGYWWFPALKTVFAGSVVESGGLYLWELEPRPFWPPDPPPETGETVQTSAYQVAWSNRAGDYAPFVDEDGNTSEHPVDIAISFLTTRSGSPGANGAWDLGDSWPADCALGIDVADVDTERAMVLKAMMPDIRASELFFGGEDSEKLSAVLERLLGPWGIACGRTMASTYRFLRLADVYPDDTSTALDDTNLVKPDNWKQKTRGRALDSVVLWTDPRPGGDKGNPQTVTEESTRRYYPSGRGVIIGDREVYRDSPYNSADLVEDSAAWTLISSRIRRLSDRVAFLEVEVGAGLFGSLDVGSGVTVHSVGLRSPITGDRLTASDDALKGVVTSLNPDFTSRNTRLTIALTDTGNVALISPSATVASWDGGSTTATVEPADWTAADDAGAFSVGDVCALLDADLTLRSDDGSNYQTAVASIDTEELEFDGVFKDAGGSTVTPDPGDVIVYAIYTEATAAMKASFAFLGQDGAVPADPNVGGDEAYTYGDY